MVQKVTLVTNYCIGQSPVYEWELINELDCFIYLGKASIKYISHWSILSITLTFIINLTNSFFSFYCQRACNNNSIQTIAEHSKSNTCQFDDFTIYSGSNFYASTQLFEWKEWNL